MNHVLYPPRETNSPVVDYTYATGGDPNLSHERALGQGGYGDVHQILNHTTNWRFARKVFQTTAARRLSKTNSNELRVLAKFRSIPGHVNIVQLFEFSPCLPYYYLDMELCDFSLFQYLYSHAETNLPGNIVPFQRYTPCLKRKEIWNIMWQIANGVNYLHYHSETHRDLKPILFKNSQWKLADFGLTSEIMTATPQNSSEGRGSSGYRAPELLIHNVFNREVDIWSMGCILFELAASRRAFDRDYNTFIYCNNPQSLCFDGIENQDRISDLVLTMLAVEPRNRPPALELLHEFSRFYQMEPGFCQDHAVDNTAPQEVYHDCNNQRFLGRQVNTVPFVNSNALSGIFGGMTS